MLDKRKDILTLNYTFKFKDGMIRHFSIDLDEKTLLLIPGKRQDYPHWTKLDFYKCINCPYHRAEMERCPIAENLADLIDFFKSEVSYERVEVTIETEQRTYIKNASLQEGISSLLGIYMTTSSCPIMEKLKPMVRFHLPFASVEETSYRAITMYLFAQLLRYKKEMVPDWDLQGLVEIYEQVRMVNEAFCKRLKHIATEDANVNALVILDNFANYIKFSIDMDMIFEFEYLFEMYLK